MRNKAIDRRRFLKRAAGTAAGAMSFPYIVSSSAFGASEKITVGFIGTGSHGIHRNLRMYLQQPDAKILTVCDVDSRHIDKAKQEVDKKYGNADCGTTKDFLTASRSATLRPCGPIDGAR